MSTGERSVLHALLRNDLAAFIQRSFQTVVPGQRYLPNWHIEAIAHHLELCRKGRIRRLILTVPPRNLKSICASVAFPSVGSENSCRWIPEIIAGWVDASEVVGSSSPR
jgi:hypothetical protein